MKARRAGATVPFRHPGFGVVIQCGLRRTDADRQQRQRYQRHQDHIRSGVAVDQECDGQYGERQPDPPGHAALGQEPENSGQQRGRADQPGDHQEEPGVAGRRDDRHGGERQRTGSPRVQASAAGWSIGWVWRHRWRAQADGRAWAFRPHRPKQVRKSGMNERGRCSLRPAPPRSRTSESQNLPPPPLTLPPPPDPPPPKPPPPPQPPPQPPPPPQRRRPNRPRHDRADRNSAPGPAESRPAPRRSARRCRRAAARRPSRRRPAGRGRTPHGPVTRPAEPRRAPSQRSRRPGIRRSARCRCASASLVLARLCTAPRRVEMKSSAEATSARAVDMPGRVRPALAAPAAGRPGWRTGPSRAPRPPPAPCAGRSTGRPPPAPIGPPRAPPGSGPASRATTPRIRRPGPRPTPRGSARVPDPPRHRPRRADRQPRPGRCRCVPQHRAASSPAPPPPGPRRRRVPRRRPTAARWRVRCRRSAARPRVRRHLAGCRSPDRRPGPPPIPGPAAGCSGRRSAGFSPRRCCRSPWPARSVRTAAATAAGRRRHRAPWRPARRSRRAARRAPAAAGSAGRAERRSGRSARPAWPRHPSTGPGSRSSSRAWSVRPRDLVVDALPDLEGGGQ